MYGISINDCNFDGNAVLANKGDTNTDGCGGAVFLGGDHHALTDNTFTNNRANGEGANGGAVFFVAEDVVVTNNRFTNNYAKLYGGAVASSVGTSNIRVVDSVFINNSARNAGGLDFYETDDAKVINCLFDGNVASNKAGALYMNGKNGRQTTAVQSHTLLRI